MKYSITAIAVSILALSAGATATAGEVEDAIIAKVVAGYGGDRFTGLKLIKFNETIYSSGAGQGSESGFSAYQMSQKETIFNPSEKKGSEENYGIAPHYVYHSRQTIAPEGIVGIDYVRGTYQPESSDNYYTAMGPMIRSIDTMLAYELVTHLELAEAKTQKPYMGRMHHVVTYNLPESPPLTLYVDDESGHITRMQRQTAFGDLEYIFSNVKTSGGVDYASDFQFFADGRLNTHAIRSASLRSSGAKSFSIDRGIKLEAERIPSEDMSVDALGENSHIVGQNGAYSVFINTDEGIIGMGGYAGLDERYEAYKKQAGHNKPLKILIVTHHHADHIAGVPDAYAMGAKLIMPEDTVASVKALIEGPVIDSRFDVLKTDRDMGEVKLLQVSTPHAAQNIMPYITGPKALFQADHYGSGYVDQVGTLNKSAIAMKEAIEAKGVDVDVLLSAHGRKVENWNAFAAAAAMPEPYNCYKGRKICR